MFEQPDIEINNDYFSIDVKASSSSYRFNWNEWVHRNGPWQEYDFGL
jgi:hypothetical protein